MKIAVFSPYATVVPHFDTELDIAQQLLDEGHEVEFFSCTGKLANCDSNLDRSESRCADCIGRREMGLELLEPNVVCHSFHDETEIVIQTEFSSVGELIDYRIDNFDIGYAALSSVVSVCRDPEPDLYEHRDALKRFLTSAWQTYQQTLEYLSQNDIDRVYIFNGRFAAVRAVLRASQSQNVDCFIHERGCDGSHYDLFENHLPHDIAKIESTIQRLWNAAESNPDREKIASQWFHDRVNRVEKMWHSFVKDQEQGRLPPEFDKAKQNVAIFTSSDDEFVAIGAEWQNHIYPDQVAAVSRIAQDLLEAAPHIQLYVRVHPNLKDVDNERLRRMLSLDHPNLTIIPPAATIDTYELVRESAMTVSFGSSVGCEAVFWDKPSVLLGPCFYCNLGSVYVAQSHQHAIELLSQQLEPKPKLGALKYGFWFQTRGFPHKYFKATGLFDGQFKGQTLYAREPSSPSTLRKLKDRARKLIGYFRSH